MTLSILLPMLVSVPMQQVDERAILKSNCPGEFKVPIIPGPRMAPMIEVEIGGKKRRMLLDTGASGGRISKKVIDELGLRPVGQSIAGDPSGKNERQVNLYRVPEVKIGGATFYGMLTFAEEGVGPDKGLADGVLSYAVFRDQLLTLDYPGRQIVFGPGILPAGSASYDLEHEIPLLHVTIGDAVVPCHVDSGSDGGLMVPTKYKAKLPLDGEPRVIGHARTLFNEIEILGVKVKSPIKFGGVSLTLPMLEMHDLFPMGNIGGRVLRKFAMTIDQKNHRIRFVEPKKEGD
ncbi:MAG: retropepsin-like domain-containing protein [Armatimonadetes bacterium]|nr:retropepsin-like domain-containing protein [Armatimonadota bacterium]